MYTVQTYHAPTSTASWLPYDFPAVKDGRDPLNHLSPPSSSRPAEATPILNHHEFALHWTARLDNPDPIRFPPPPPPSAIRASWKSYISTFAYLPFQLSLTHDPELTAQLTLEVGLHCAFALDHIFDAGLISARTREAHRPLYTFLFRIAEKFWQGDVERNFSLLCQTRWPNPTVMVVRAIREVSRVVVKERWVWPLIGVDQDEGVSMVMRLRWLAEVVDLEDDVMVDLGAALPKEERERQQELIWGRKSQFWRRCQGAAELEAVPFRMPTRLEQSRPVVVREDDDVSRNFESDFALHDDMIDTSARHNQYYPNVMNMINEDDPRDDVENQPRYFWDRRGQSGQPQPRDPPLGELTEVHTNTHRLGTLIPFRTL